MTDEAKPRVPHLRAVPANANAHEQRVMQPRRPVAAVEPEHVEQSEPIEGAFEEADDVVEQVQEARVATGMTPRSMRGLGSDPTGNINDSFGTLANAGTHVMATSGAGATGALIGGLASMSWSGAGIGALTNIALLGLTASLLGSGRLSNTTRVVYGVLALLTGAGAGWLVWRRRR